jgi:hypothetical protein
MLRVSARAGDCGDRSVRAGSAAERSDGQVRATTSVLATIARVVAQNLAFVGVVASFWHITWIAGVGCWQAGWWGWRCTRPATRAWNAIRRLAWRQGLQNVGNNPTSEGSLWKAGT